MTQPQDSGRGTPLDPSGELRNLASDCVHCGFCLPSCPTYQLWGEEMDSPRGRIHLITQILDGATGTAAAAQHLDRCLGCMACVTACPSGVRYDRLIEAARGWAEEVPASASPGRASLARVSPGTASSAPTAPGPERPGAPGSPGAALPPRSARDRALRAAVFSLFPYPRRLRAAIAPLRVAQRAGLDGLLDRSGLAGRLPPELAAALHLAPDPPSRDLSGRERAAALRPVPRRRAAARRASRAGSGAAAATRRPQRALPERVPARGPRRAVVGMLTGCVQQVFFPQVNDATANVLAAEGCDVIIPAGQGCCGALSLHGGRRDEAAGFARRTIEVFERAGVDAVVINSAGCGSAMKEYADLLAGQDGWDERAAALAGRVRDLTEFLVELGPVAPRHPLPATVAYHDACHLAHAQKITAPPRELLAAVPGLRLADIADGGVCCGSAGIYNLVQPEAASELGQRKAEAVAATGADLLVSGNPGCAMQIASALAARGARLPMRHTAEVLDASIRGADLSTLLT
jgi:glycolate oxidase iron-sulfur subunit